jgi:formylglycine-generating enzyme required for sulfatase activity
MGELHGAIAQKAEALFSQLSDEDQRKVQQIFLRLVRPGEGEADTRRRATLAEVGAEEHRLAKQLADERLLVTSQVAGGGEETIEVSHEALIRHWDRLKGWVDADCRFLLWEQRLRIVVDQYEETHKSADLLLRGFPLTEALEWLKKKPDSFPDRERQFVTVSKNRMQRQRMAAGAIAGLVLIVMGLTIWLWGYTGDQALLKVQSMFVSIHVPPVMQEIAAGSFKQGDVQGRGDQYEKPQHQVTLKSFAMGMFEVTFEEYDRFALATGRMFPGDQGWGRGKQPVINVSWDEAKAYAEWLSKETGNRYRLPTESEWEYAARSEGKDELWAGTSNENELKEYAVYAVNSGNRTALVGLDQGRKPNASGLYDMSGNVWEWVEDCWHNTYQQAPTDGAAWLEARNGNCQLRVLRGGSWDSGPANLTAFLRSRYSAYFRYIDIGFRLVQDIP